MATYTVGATVKIAATVNNYGNRSGVIEYIAGNDKPIYGVRLDGDNWITQFSRDEIAGPIATAIAWQLARMDADATEADARAALITATARENNDANGQCIYCGRDNRGHEHEPCSDDCPHELMIAEAPAMLELLREMLCAEKCRPWHPEIRAIVARIDAATDEDDDEDDQVCRNGKAWADCNCC